MNHHLDIHFLNLIKVWNSLSPKLIYKHNSSFLSNWSGFLLPCGSVSYLEQKLVPKARYYLFHVCVCKKIHDSFSFSSNKSKFHPSRFKKHQVGHHCPVPKAVAFVLHQVQRNLVTLNVQGILLLTFVLCVLSLEKHCFWGFLGALFPFCVITV